jgi:hypothetical protein
VVCGGKNTGRSARYGAHSGVTGPDSDYPQQCGLSITARRALPEL